MVCRKNHEGPTSLCFALVTSSFNWADRDGKLHHMLSGVTSQQWQKWHYGVLYNTSHGTRPWTPLWAPVSNQVCCRRCCCSRTEIDSRGKVTLTLWKALTCTIASTYLTLAVTGLLCRVLWLTLWVVLSQWYQKIVRFISYVPILLLSECHAALLKQSQVTSFSIHSHMFPF